ncbi:hypothetical protein [Nonomuraea jabiensis]|uniref:hypothetical protein n=1 Tax=Nonomuraea jabiensis TaxID=882448 RepID=UPI003D744949
MSDLTSAITGYWDAAAPTFDEEPDRGATCSGPARVRSSTACSSARPGDRVSEMRDPRRRARRPAA